MPRRQSRNAIQRRTTYPVGPGATQNHEFVRATDSIRTNSPDGWMADKGPVWWVGSDNAWFGQVGPNGPQWDAYGITAPPDMPLNRNRGRFFGGRPIEGSQLTGHGVLAAVTRATNLIVGPVCRTDWLIRSSPTGIGAVPQEIGDIARQTPLWLGDPQLTGAIPGGSDNRPTVPRAKRLGPHDFWRTVLTHALWYGSGAILYVADSNGMPLAGTLRIVNPSRWGEDEGRFVLDPDGDGPLYSDVDGAFNVAGTVWHMRVLRGLPPIDGNTAGGALTRSGLVILAGENLNNYLATTMASGVPAGVLKVSTQNFGPDDAADLKGQWMGAHGTSRRSVAVLNSSVDFEALQLSAVDADLVNAKGANLVDIAHAFGLSAAWLDASMGTGASITYANITDRRRDLVDHTLSDWGRSIEDFVSALLPYGQVMRINWASYVTALPDGVDAPPALVNGVPQ